jgi:hypothetical protein
MRIKVNCSLRALDVYFGTLVHPFRVTTLSARPVSNLHRGASSRRPLALVSRLYLTHGTLTLLDWGFSLFLSPIGVAMFLPRTGVPRGASHLGGELYASSPLVAHGRHHLPHSLMVAVP